MSKFSFEAKMKAVEAYLDGKESFRDIAKRIGTLHQTIQKWVALYKAHGPDGLQSSYTNYAAQFKMDVLNFMREKGTSLIETAAFFNISAPSTILQWKRAFDEQGVDALYSKKRGRPTMKKGSKKKQPVEGSQEALIAEIERLRMENAYLKKLNALVQEERKLKNVKKHK